MGRRARTAATLLVGQGLGRGAQAAYTIVMVRELSRRGYGDLAYLLALAGILIPVGDLGFSRLMIRDVARATDPAALAREILRVRGIGVGAVALLFTLVGLAGGLPADAGVVLGAGAFLLAEGLAYGYESAAVGSERPGRFAAVQAVGGLAVLAAAVIVLTRATVTPASAMGGLAAASVVKLAAHAAVWARGSHAVRGLRALPVRAWLGEALPFLVLAVLGAVYYRAGIVALHAIKGPAETAPYAAAMRVFDGIAVLGGVGFAAVSPSISRIHRDRPAHLWPVWRRMVSRAALAVVPGAAVLVVVAHPLADALFGARYAQAAGEALAYLAPGMALAILQNLSASIVFMGDERGPVIALSAFNVAALVTLVVAGSALSGSTGAAVATSLAELLSFTSFAVLVRNRHGRPGLLAAPPVPPARGA